MRTFLIVAVWLWAGWAAAADELPLLFEVDALEFTLQIRRADDHTLVLFQDGQEAYRISLDEWMNRARSIMNLDELKNADEAYRAALASGDRSIIEQAKRQLIACRKKSAGREKYYAQVRDAFTGRKPLPACSVWDTEDEMRAALAVFPFKFSEVEKKARSRMDATKEKYERKLASSPRAKQAELLAAAREEMDSALEELSISAIEIKQKLEILRWRAKID